MLDTLRAWLNGTRDYNTGAALYNIVGTDEEKKALFAQGYSLYRNFKLQEELLAICKSLKTQKNATANVPASAAPAKRGISKKEKANELNQLIASITDQAAAIAKAISPPNPELYKACKLEADKVYKEYSNKRAVLFHMIPENKYEDANRQDLVAGRKDLALEVVRLHQKTSELYDLADHVKLHGRLPDQEPDDIDNEIADLQDHQVKPALDNARKAHNKLKGKDQTAERVVLMQKHEAKIKKLEDRWASLNQKQ